MVKILSKAGQSLADMYQVAGSIVGVDELETRELGIMHELGATVFSERFTTTILKARSAPTAQNTNIDMSFDGQSGTSMARVLGVAVFCNIAAQMATFQVSVHREPGVGTNVDQDYPVWIWGGDSFPTRISLDGTLVQRDVLLGAPGQVHLPNFLEGSKQGTNPVLDLRMRGRTAGFGAGTETIWVLIYLAFTVSGGISDFGARIPSW